MDKEIVRAYLWQDIIRLGFSPSKTKDQKSWLLQYGRSLKEFWEVNYPKPPAQSGSFISATIDTSISIGMTYEYAIESTQKFTVRLMYAPPEENRELMWIHDLDERLYFSFPIQTFLTNHNKRNPAVQKMTLNDIGEVVDSLIMHPTPHQHIESPLDNHDIRVGGGLLNPFLYLFHLRIQLCPDTDRRMAERERLISLFDTAIRENSVIAPSELMKIP
jgi:hypothetical protein